MRRIIIALSAVAALAGCTSAQQAAVGVGIERAQAASDTAAEAALAAVCGVTVGAYFRLEDARRQTGLHLICAPGGELLPVEGGGGR